MESPITSGNVTLDGNGRGVVTLGPQVYGVVWHVTRMVTSVSGTAEISCRLSVYRQTETPSNMVDGTFVAGQDVSETDLPLRGGEVLVFVWEDGPAGAVATITLSGEIQRGIS